MLTLILILGERRTFEQALGAVSVRFSIKVKDGFYIKKGI